MGNESYIMDNVDPQLTSCQYAETGSNILFVRDNYGYLESVIVNAMHHKP